jgi:alpha-tubulin suppressor-like RCC1 family protein
MAAMPPTWSLWYWGRDFTPTPTPAISSPAGAAGGAGGLTGRGHGCATLPTPVWKTADPTKAPVSVVAGSGYALAVLADGSVLSWGTGARGRLGHGTEADVVRPTPIAALVATGAHIVAAAASDWFSLFVGRDGRLWACGQVPGEFHSGGGGGGGRQWGGRLVSLLCVD